MSGRDDEGHWREVQRGRDANTTREDRRDDPLLHPANEGHDAERERDRLERWAAQEGPGGPDRQRLQELQGAQAGGAPGAEGEIPTEYPEAPKAHGSPYNRDENVHEHHTRGGEAKKHPRAREETTPEPGRGASSASGATGETPTVTVGPDGQPRYVHGQVPRVKGPGGGT